MLNILLVDDEANLRNLLATALTRKGHLVDATATAEEAIARLHLKKYDVVLTDLYLHRQKGTEVVEAAQRVQPQARVLVMSGGGDVVTAVTCMKLGAADFLQKPFSLESLFGLLSTIPERETPPAKEHGARLDGHFIATSPAMTEILQKIELAAPSSATILIRGESGVGKEVVARAIHRRSGRKNQPFVALNCAAVPDHLLEDELFGHVRGAFTGADKLRIGRFEEANHGTLLLDEIGTMSLPLQAKLLRVLQEREFERLGSTATIRCDVRIIAATNADLEAKVQRGEFREDLYYRLNVIPLIIPPLRERRQDILPLAEYFIQKHCGQLGLKLKRVSNDAMAALQSYHWPGNVRELQNMIERTVVLTGLREVITLHDLGDLATMINPVLKAGLMPATEELNGQINFDHLVSEFERKLICQILVKTGGNQSKAADLLKLKRTTLGAKIRKLNLDSYAVSA